MDVIMYFRPRGCPKKDKICGSWIGALGGYAGVLNKPAPPNLRHETAR